MYADIRFVKRRDAPRIEPPSALASLGGYASPSQSGIDGGCSSQHLTRQDAASPCRGELELLEECGDGEGSR